MARITTKTVRNARLRQLHRLRGSIWSLAKDLRGLSRGSGLRHHEPASQLPYSQIPPIFQTQQSQDQVARHCLCQSIYHRPVTSTYEPHR